MNKIKRAAIKFIKKAGNNINFESVENCLRTSGSEVIFHNTVEGDKLINEYGLINAIHNKRALTVKTKNKMLIFIDNTLSSEDKLRSLLHETGHIKLNHLEENENTANIRQQDMEAEAFAYYVLNSKQNKKAVTLSVIITALISLTLSCLFYQFIKRDYVSSDSYPETVYITTSGEKYHRENCIHIQGRKYTALSIEKAKEIYPPCLVCNPQ